MPKPIGDISFKPPHSNSDRPWTHNPPTSASWIGWGNLCDYVGQCIPLAHKFPKHICFHILSGTPWEVHLGCSYLGGLMFSSCFSVVLDHCLLLKEPSHLLSLPSFSDPDFLKNLSPVIDTRALWGSCESQSRLVLGLWFRWGEQLQRRGYQIPPMF